MRSASLLITAFLMLPAFAGADPTASTTIAVEGMTSGACVAAVKAQLGRAEGVIASVVSLEKGEAEVTFDPSTTEPARIAEAVSKIGFEAKPKDGGQTDAPTPRKELATLERSAEAAMPGLSPEEQRAGVVLIRELAKGDPVGVPQFARALGVSVKEAEVLVRDSGLSHLVHPGEDGRVQGVWGLSTVETPHKLLVNGRTLWAWCAGDTLFLPEVLGQTAAVESRDPVTGELVRLTVSPGGVEAVDPKDITVSFLSVDKDNVDFTSATRIMATACHYIFFFASRASAERWAARHPGKVVLLPLQDAFRLARRLNLQVFGGELARQGGDVR